MIIQKPLERPLLAKGETLLLGTCPTLLAVVISSSTDAACSVLCFSARFAFLNSR